MKKTWILSLEEDKSKDKVIVFEGREVTYNGTTITPTKIQSKYIFCVTEDGQLLHHHNHDEGKVDYYTITRDLGLKSLGLNKRLYLSNVDVESGHILNSRRNPTLFDMLLILFLFSLAAAVSTIASVVMIPILFIVYYFIYRNKVVLIESLPEPKYIDGIQSTTVGSNGVVNTSSVSIDINNNDTNNDNTNATNGTNNNNIGIDNTINTQTTTTTTKPIIMPTKITTTATISATDETISYQNESYGNSLASYQNVAIDQH